MRTRKGARSWDTKGPHPDIDGQDGQRSARKGLESAVANYNAAVAAARTAATQDRQQALAAVQHWRGVVESRLGQNPFGAEYQAQTLGILRDARARQYQAAVEELRQQYAALGKPLDPRMLTALRTQMALQENSDLRALSVDTAGKKFQADAMYAGSVGDTVQMLDRILSNTEHMPNPQELALLMRLGAGGN